MSQTGAHSQWKTGTSGVTAPTPLYLIETSTGVYELTDTQSDADAVLVLDTGVIQIDSDTDASGALGMHLLDTTAYLAD